MLLSERENSGFLLIPFLEGVEKMVVLKPKLFGGECGMFFR
jgi:hypothetical protein